MTQPAASPARRSRVRRRRHHNQGGYSIALVCSAVLPPSKGYKLTILSNGDRDMLKGAGPHIGFPFDHVISVQEAGYFKPHWKIYAKAKEIIGEDRSSIGSVSV